MAEKTKKIGPMKYLAQVRQEGRKVVWPTSRETMITTILVIIVMIIFGIFFFFVDWIAANGTQFLLNLWTNNGPQAGG
ncbi:MAG TPA: preprotein translocase subunit SecE [Hellea balneolensis]|uniref:Protein translocase subunit SecE n=1 Tax=Hellea balneolensis TaxID=287478 RepID=A0A7C5QNJ8_9PROT|nr:preprotein translocase subunit SecE [Hellea balneolensis]